MTIGLAPDVIVEELTGDNTVRKLDRDATLEDMEDDHDNNENVGTVREASSMAQSLWHVIM
jgi:hypothetical protein